MRDSGVEFAEDVIDVGGGREVAGERLGERRLVSAGLESAGVERTPSLTPVVPLYSRGVTPAEFSARELQKRHILTASHGIGRLWQASRVFGGTRVTASMIVGQIGAGSPIEEVLADYPYLQREDVLQALRNAAEKAASRR